jgi:S1-C subfamily serine protease
MSFRCASRSQVQATRVRLLVSRLIGFCVLAFFMTAVQETSWAGDKIDPDALKKVKAATVHIRVESADGDVSEGSGFVTIARGLIVTNAHVVGMLDNDSPKPAKIEVTFNSGEANSKTVEVKVGYVDGETDLALLMMAATDAAIIPDLLPVALSQSLTETQDVFVVGFPLGKRAGPNVTVTATTVTSLRKDGGNIKQVQVNGGCTPGTPAARLSTRTANSSASPWRRTRGPNCTWPSPRRSSTPSRTGGS